ncbi:MAG: YceI family protein [Flavobacterium sp.]|nr:YceI family protein [Pedobacter sp.]
MKKIISSLGLLTLIIITMSFVKPAKKEVYKIDIEKSSIEWLAKKVTGQHVGTIKLSSGQLEANGNALKNGSFLIDMNTIVCTDLQGEYNGKLIGHLRSEDFFSVEKNPVSKFDITKVTAAGADRVNITGNLTIKGITQPITFPASVKKQDNAIVAVAKNVKVDRTKYDIRYGSKSFFASIGDKAIDNEFELSINLVATK